MLFVNQYERVPYKALNFLCAMINYGGAETTEEFITYTGSTSEHPRSLDPKPPTYPRPKTTCLAWIVRV